MPAVPAPPPVEPAGALPALPTEAPTQVPKGSEESELPVVTSPKLVDPRKKKHDESKLPKVEPAVPEGVKPEAIASGPPVAVPPGGFEGEKKPEKEATTALPTIPVATEVLPAVPNKDKEEKKEKQEKKPEEVAPPGLPEVVSAPLPSPTPTPSPTPEVSPSPLPAIPPGLPVEPGPEKKPEPITIPKPETVGVKTPETTPPPVAGMGEAVKLPAVSPMVEPPVIQKEVVPALVPTPVPMPEKKTEPAPMPPVVARTPEPPVAPGSSLPVVSFHEEEYTVKQGDSFVSISKGRYLSDGYANALRRHNEDDPLRSQPLNPSPANTLPVTRCIDLWQWC